MNTKVDKLLTPKQGDKLAKATIEMINSRALDPSNPPSLKDTIDSYASGRSELLAHYKSGAFDVSKPDVLYGMIWQDYVSYLAMHGQPSNKKGTRFLDTTTKRIGPAKQLAEHLSRTPTAVDLKAAFPTLTQLDDGICKAIDKDLKNLTK
jgi:hypothetical protein